MACLLSYWYFHIQQCILSIEKTHWSKLEIPKLNIPTTGYNFNLKSSPKLQNASTFSNPLLLYKRTPNCKGQKKLKQERFIDEGMTVCHSRAVLEGEYGKVGRKNFPFKSEGGGGSAPPLPDLPCRTISSLFTKVSSVMVVVEPRLEVPWL